jgi:hypothetical protein
VSELLDVRVIGTPQTTTQAVFRLSELFEVNHCDDDGGGRGEV